MVRLAIDQGHQVTAIARNAAGIDLRARIVIDDVKRPGCFDEHLPGHDVVLSALGIKRTSPANPWSALASPPDMMSRTTAMLVPAMRQAGIRAEASLDWCCPRPTRLTNGPLTRCVKTSESFPMTAAISRADVAWWMVDQAEQEIRDSTPMITGEKRRRTPSTVRP